MTSLEIIQLVTICLITLALVIYYAIKAIKNGWLKQLTSTIDEAIVEAERQWPEGHGTEKKKFVIEKVKVKCLELGIPYSLLYKLISKLIDTIIANYNIVVKK